MTRNDAALATVLGHEVAHATAEHAAERIEAEHLTKVAAAIIAGGVAFTPRQYLRVAALLGVAGSLPFSRSQESRGGPHRMRRASKGKEPPGFASDHSSDEHRIERIQEWMPEAERARTPAPAS